MDRLYEFDREPVSPDKLQPARHFAALLAGEHVAGTEFVIGALFVSWGARPFDILVGLIVGNLLAVLTWTFVCTPIAIQTRLTLYWYLRRIAGPGATAVYNILNAILFCILAGCMITVSASSIRILFGIPPQTNWYPEDFRWVILVLALGAVVVGLAILGFKRLAQFAEVCSVWMFFMFIAGALALLPGLAATSGLGEVRSFSDFLLLAEKTIWTGVAPTGQQSLTFWHIAAFAWICNLAMHGGLSDMALFRYARSVSCGLTSAVGMFFGHYIAWLCAGVMGAATALALHTTMDKLDSGTIAMQALGVAGGIAVVLAGWTTSNPTLYRAGLAFQAVTPNWPRWLVTLLAGIATTIVATFPFVFTQLLNFVGWYGLLLMPVGAIVFVEHWVFPRIGLTQFWASQKGLIFNWPALASWGTGILVAWVLTHNGWLHLFFLFIPIWLLTAVLYTVLAALAGARVPLTEVTASAPATPSAPPPEGAAPPSVAASPNGVNRAWLWTSGAIALASLLVCIVLPIWHFAKGIEGYEERLAQLKSLILWASLIHLTFATIWAVRKEKSKGGF
jgi:NCS1 family nucleobase:cation symporter-1